MATAADLHLLGIGYRHVRGGEDSFERAGQRIRKSGREAAGSVSAVDGALDHLRTRFSSILSPAAAVDAALAAIAVTAIAVVGAMGLAVKTSVEFEARLVAVGKTANIEGAALRSLGDDIDALSRRIPVASRELLEIAESAGSLGVEGAANILKFTETVAKLGRSSDLAGDEGATALARILNVTGESVSTVDALASVIVSLGNSFAATESEIAHHAGEVAKATAVYNIGSAASSAMAATLASFGVRAELAGSAVGRSFRVIENAVKSGGEEMAALAKVSGVSAEEIRQAWSRGPVEAFNVFLQGVRNIQQSGGNVAQALETIKLEGEEVLKVIPVLALQFDTLAKAQGIAAQEAANPTALNREFARAATTLKTELDLLRNIVTSLYKTIGDQLAPVVKEIVVEVRTWLATNQDAARSLGADLAEAVRFAARAVAFLIRHFDEIKALAIGLIAIQLTSWLHGVGVAVVGQVTAWRTWVAVKINAVRSEAAYAAEVAASSRGVAAYSVATTRGAATTATQATAARGAAVAHGAAATATTAAAGATSALTVAQRAQVATTALVVRGQQALTVANGQTAVVLGHSAVATGALTIEQRALLATLAALYAAWRGYVSGGLIPAGTVTVALTGATRALTGTLGGQAALVGTVTGQTRLLTAGNVAAAASEQLLAAGSTATLAPLAGQTLALTGATTATTALTFAQRALIVVTAALRAAWQAFTAWLVANPITAVAVALGALAAALYLVWKNNKEAREESERYHEELRTGRYLVDGYAAAHDELAKRMEDETKRLRELKTEHADTASKIAALEPIVARMQKALEGGDNAGYRQAVEDVRSLGVSIQEVGARGSAFQQVTRQLDAMRAALAANEAQAKLSADEVAVAERKMREGIEDSLEAERRRMLMAQANVAELEAQAQQAQLHLDALLSAPQDDLTAHMVTMATERVRELQRAAEDAATGIASIGQRLETLRQYAREEASGLFDEAIGQGQQSGPSYDRAATLLRKSGATEEEIQRQIELTQIFAGATANLTAEQKKNNDTTDFGNDKKDTAKKRFEQLRQEMTATIAGLALMTTAWGQGDEAVAKANRQLLISTTVAQRSAEDLQKHGDQILAWVTAQVDGERQLAQAQTRSGIKQRIRDLDQQIEAYTKNAAVVSAVILQQEEEARVREATAGAIEGERLELEKLANDENQKIAKKTFLATKLALDEQVVGLQAVAVAMASGDEATEESARRQTELQRTIESTTAGVLPQYREAIAEVVRKLFDLQKADELAFREKSATTEIASLERRINSYERGAVAVAKVAAEEERAGEVRQLLANTTDEERKRLEPLVKTLISYRDVLASVGEEAALKQHIGELRLLTEWWGKGKAAGEAMTIALEIQRRVLEATAKGQGHMAEQIAAAVIEEHKLNATLAETERQAKIVDELFTNFLQGVQSSLSDAIDDALAGNLDSWEDFFASVTGLFRKMVADWVAQLATTKLTVALGLDATTNATGATQLVSGASQAAAQLVAGAQAAAAELVSGAAGGAVATTTGGTAAGVEVATGGAAGGAAVAAGGAGAAGELAAGAGLAAGQVAGAGATAAAQLVAGAQVAAAQLAAGGAAGGAGNAAGGVAGGAAGAAGAGINWAGIASAGGYSSAGALGAAAAGFAVFAIVVWAILAWQKSQKEYWAAVSLSMDATGQVITEAGEHTKRRTQMDAASLASLLGLAKQWGQGVIALIEGLGGQLLAIDESIEISRKGRGKKTRYKVISDFGVEIFKDAKQALEYAIIQGARLADASGLSPLVEAALRRTTAKTLDEFQKRMAAILEIDQLIDPGGAELRQVEAKFDRLRQALMEANLPASILIDTLGRLALAEIDAMQASRDSITGRQRTAAEELEEQKRKALMWNAERELRIAELELQKMRLEAIVAEVTGYRDATQAELQIGRDRLNVRQMILEGESQLTEAEMRLAQVNVAVVQAQINAINQILANMPAAIDPSEIRVGGGGGGGTRRQDQENLRDMLADSARDLSLEKLSDYGRGLAEINKKWDDAIPLAHGNAELLEKIAKARREETEALRQQAIGDLYSRLRDYERGTIDTSSPQGQLAAIQEEARQFREEFEESARELGLGAGRIARGLARITAAEQARIKALTEQVIDGLGLPMEQIRDKAHQLGQTLSFLRDRVKDGTISAERFNEVFAQIGKQAESELLGLASGLLEQMGNDRQAAEVKARLEQANFHLQVAQLNMLFETYRGLGLLSEEVLGIVQGALDWINDPTNHPRFDPADYLPANDFGGGGGSDASNVAEENERRRQEILDQIREWNELGQSDFTAGLRDLNDTLVSMTADARRLGISLTDLMAAHANAVEDFWDRTLAPYEEGESATLLERLAEINRTFDEMIAAAEQYGGDQARIEAARLREVERFWDEALEPIRELQERFQLGELGGVSPEQRLQQAQARFNDLAQRALAGDAEAIQALPAAVEELLEQQRAFSGTGPAYQALVATIQNVLAQIIALGGGSGLSTEDRATALGASEVAGAAPPVAAIPGAYRAEAPRPAPLPASASRPPSLLPSPDDDRVERLVGAMEIEAGQRRDDRREVDELRRQVDRLVEIVSDQNDQVADLSAEVRNLSALVESQERRRMAS